MKGIKRRSRYIPPLWASLNDDTRQALVDYQAKHYPCELLNPPGERVTVIIDTEIENIDEIDYIMRQPPGPKWREE